MSKKAAVTEKPKPKYQQTKLCFAAAPKKTDQDLEKSIRLLNISSSKKRNQPDHADPCNQCDKSIPRISCTAIKPDSNEHCNLQYCQECIENKIKEDIDSIDDRTQYVNKSGDIIQHRDTDKLKWACLVCRGLCDCEMCDDNQKTKINKKNNKTTPRLSFHMKTIEPPKLTEIDLLYPEDQLWIRLEIREFLFRFGDLYGFDARYLTPLQNVQGDWKLKRLGAYVVWRVLDILSNVSQYTYDESEERKKNQQNSIPQRAKKIMHAWMVESKIMASYLDTASRVHALLELLCLEGMTGRRWQDVAELLALAEYESLPVPTSRDDPMDIDEEEQAQRIARFKKKSSRSSALISNGDELVMINMVLQLLLFDTEARQTLSLPSNNTKEQVEFKKIQKDYVAEEMKNKIRRNHLATRVTQLKMIRQKEKELKQAEMELDELETHIRDERMQMEKKKLEMEIQHAKSQKRMEPAGHDNMDNEYWVFHDMLDHEHHLDHRNSEPFWAYGVIVIGPGYNKDGEKKWWYVKGKAEITSLMNWIKKQDSDKSMVELVHRLNQRLNYLQSLELAVYGEGFFS